MRHHFALLALLGCVGIAILVVPPVHADPVYAITLLVPSGALRSWAFGINDQGVVVGTYLGSDGLTLHGFTYNSDSGVFAAVDFPGASETCLTGINNQGDVVGVEQSTEGNFWFALSRETFSTINVLSPFATAPCTQPQGGLGVLGITGINARGMIVGTILGSGPIGDTFYGFIGLPVPPK